MIILMRLIKFLSAAVGISAAVTFCVLSIISLESIHLFVGSVIAGAFSVCILIVLIKSLPEDDDYSYTIMNIITVIVALIAMIASVILLIMYSWKCIMGLNNHLLIIALISGIISCLSRNMITVCLSKPDGDDK